MIAMRPIDEPDVIDLLNNGRFEGELRGYVVLEGPEYLGHMLYKVEGELTTVLECGLENNMLVDGGVRACIAAGEHAGATRFIVNAQDAALAKWAGVFCKNDGKAMENKNIFEKCK